ncbi:MAG: PHP domain-containing protein [Bacillota bacterium]
MDVYLADLHIHTALSPCAEAEMTPPAIVAQAKSRGIRILGICDHNSAENVRAVAEAGEAAGVAVIGGIEVQTREDVHVLTFFSDLHALLGWQDEVYANLPECENDEERFGEELILDSSGAVKGRLRRLLLASTSMGIDDLGRRVRALGGLVVPAHVDRPSFSLIRNLGLIPPGLEPDCIEVSWRTGAKRARTLFPEASGLPLIVSSDAHRLDEIRGYTVFLMESPSFDEIRLALRSAGGRMVVPVDEL